MNLTGQARKRITDHFGEDRTRVISLLEVLSSVYESAATLEVEDIEPYLGAAGSVMP